MANDIQESINKAINTIVQQRIDALELDKTVIGVIDSVVDSTRSIYKVKCNGGFLNARSLENNAIYLPGMSVYVQIPQNDMTQEKLIISRATSLLHDEKIDVVISAINNFAILGNNVAKSNIGEKELSIRSYHNPIVETNYSEYIEHRAKLLYAADHVGNNYDIDWEAFNLYKQNATALMVEAEFRTSLDAAQRRQYNGEYGININAVFQNSDYQYGETQGEIFDYFAGDTKVDDVEGNTVTLAEKDARVQEILSGQDISISIDKFLEDDGYLDQYIYEIDNLISVYAENNKESYVPTQKENNNAYVLILKELKLLSNYSDMWTAYEEWRNLVVAAPENKIVSLSLDSNHMTGTPFYFTSWTSQYAIFELDLTKFKGIDSIVFYKQGFLLDEEKCEAGVNIGSGTEPKDDIFVRNLKIYALQPISSIYGDYRLEIQSPDGLIFNSLEDEDLTVSAKLTKAYYEDLSTKASFRWFKKSKNVTSVSSDGYNQYGGIGWEYLNEKGNKEYFSTKVAENMAYENIYKCVAKIDDTVILSQEFTIYNKAFDALLKLESDLGTRFSFDSGNPVFTCKIKEGNKDYQEITSDNYKYYWAVVVNGQRTFLTGEQIKISLSKLTEAIEATRIQNMIRNVKFFNGDSEIDLSDQTHLSENISRATRIQYPMSNLLDESVIIIECYVNKKYSEKYYDIGSASLSIENSANALAGTYKVIIENGEQLFQYDEYGNAPNAKKLKTPQEILPLICHLYNPSGLEVPNSHYVVSWTVPIENTLIIPSNSLQYNPIDKLNDLDTNKQFVFNIAQIYNENYQNNQIECQVNYNDLTINQETNFYFGKVGNNGTNGTDMVLRILSKNTHQNLDSEPLILYRYDYDSTNKIYKKIWFNDGSTNETIASPSIGHIKAQLYQKNIEVTADNIIWNVAGNTQMYNNKNGKFLEISNGGASGTTNQGKYLIWKETFNQSGLSNYIIRAQADYKDKTYYAFYGLPQIIYNTTSIPKYTRITINKKTLLKEVVYNADGRNPIYNHTAGVELINVPENYSIEWTVENTWISSTALRHEPDFLLLEERDRENGVIKITKEKNLRRIYILPNDEYAGSNNDNIVVAKITSDNLLIATVVIPIHMSLNTFGLASLNAWDGNTVTIDNDNGYIMAPQIGAGEKDKNNRFTGIVMGKTETYTGKSENQKDIGLLGYAHGIQSIFLDSQTGEAYFGLPDGYRLDKSGNIPIPVEGNNKEIYNEGRIELKPGDVSKIGGWYLGRGSLYYASSNGTDNIKISDSYGDTWANTSQHLKDIGHTHRGILLNAIPLPYISVKGRQLTVGNNSNYDINNSSGNAALTNGDSLELNLDPNQKDFFTMFRHFKDGNTWKREPLVGIDAMGRFYTNALKDRDTSLSMNYVPGFGQSSANKKYVGLFIGYGVDALFKAFIPTGAASTDSLYLSGGSSTDECNRPIGIYGKTISLYASNINNSTKAGDTRVILNNTTFEAGNFTTSYIQLYTSGASENHIKTPGALTIETTTTTNGQGNINIYAGGNNRSYLTLNRNGNAVLQGWTSLTQYAHNGDISLNAQFTDSSGTKTKSQLTLKQAIVLDSKRNEIPSVLQTVGTLKLGTSSNNLDMYSATDTTISAGSSFTLTAGGSGNGIYLPVASIQNARAHFKSVKPLDITSIGEMKLQPSINFSVIANAGISLRTENSGPISISTKSGEVSLFTESNSKVSISSGLGGFGIQQMNYNNNAISTSNLGLNAQYGIFNSAYDGNGYSIWTKQKIYAKDAYITEFSPGSGAKGYAFSQRCVVSGTPQSAGNHTETYNPAGNHVYDLIKYLADNLAAAVVARMKAVDDINNTIDGINSDIDGLEGRLGTVEANYVSKEAADNRYLKDESFENWKRDIFRPHSHNLTDWTETHIGSDGGDVRVPYGTSGVAE